MARQTVIECDRCGRRLEESGAIGVGIVSPSSNGGRPLSRELDLCDECARRVIGVATGDRRSDPQTIGKPSSDVALAEVRERAALAVQGYNLGDGPDDLLAALRDVASGANRAVHA